MKKKINKKIKDKSFKKEDILKLSNELYSIYKKTTSNNKHFYITINTDNEETFEFENSKLEIDEKILDIKKISHISITFVDSTHNKRIDINLTEGNDKWNNNFSVEGHITAWVDSNTKKIEEILESIKPQNNFFSKYKGILFHLIAINLGFLFLRILDNLLKRYNYVPTKPENQDLFNFLLESFPILQYLYLILISWVFGMFIVLPLWNKIDNLIEKTWPSIEFNFGPEHKNYAKNNRKTMGIICSLIIIPILLQIFF
ncbi:MAG: hypothetical protein KAS90_00190 [Candidatus Aenigmarchaeota archaeon]|nr:hypothetical protein [Candidatus Aenigmarchaeota archaeon]